MGTRPEMIKMWPVIKKLDQSNFKHIMVHTGQNYTPELKDFFFSDLKLRKPDYDLSIDVSSYAQNIYLFNYIQKGKLKTKKFVVIH